jgi:hypothetical protein
MSSDTNDDIKKIVEKCATVATAKDSQGISLRRGNRSENYLTIVNIRYEFFFVILIYNVGQGP